MSYKRRKRREGVGEEVVLSPETQRLLGARSGRCFACFITLLDFECHGRLTDFPGGFPVGDKVDHVELEKLGAPGSQAGGTGRTLR